VRIVSFQNHSDSWSSCGILASQEEGNQEEGSQEKEDTPSQEGCDNAGEEG